MSAPNKPLINQVDIGVSKYIGSYSDAILVNEADRAVWLFTSGTPGIDGSGKFSNNITDQSRLAWKNILDVLSAAQLSINDIIKVTATVTDPVHIQPYVAIRKEILGDLKPALMLSVVNQTFKPEILVEIEVIAYGIPAYRNKSQQVSTSS